MTPGLATRDGQLPPAYSARLDALAVAPLWTVLHSLLPPERTTRVLPHHWKWRELREPLLEAARLVPIEQAERRVLMLCNPGLPGNASATATLYAGFQIILPGEMAPSHHHTAAALRLIVEGEGAYTTVDGVKCVMERGDLIITPPMRWHDHGHEGRDPVIWLDGLDIPLVRSVEANWASAMKPASTPASDVDSSQDEFTAAGLVPRQSRYEETGYPQVRWPWRQVRAALAALAATAPRRAPVVLRHVNPRTGAYPLRTMGSEARWLRPGEDGRAERRTGSEVVYVVEGQGESRVGDRVIPWEEGDVLAVPPWHWVEHRNRSSAAPACLFHLNDEPALRALGLWHEEVGGA